MPLISQQARSALDQQHGPTHLGLVENNKDLWYLIDGRSSSASKYLDQKHYNEAKLPVRYALIGNPGHEDRYKAGMRNTLLVLRPLTM